MDLTFLYSAAFDREWKRQRLTDDDLIALEDEISKSPDSAPVLRGAGGLRKICFAPPSRHTGKSGAMRVGFAYFRVNAAIIVISMFSKNDAANLSAAQRSEITKWLKLIERDFR